MVVVFGSGERGCMLEGRRLHVIVFVSYRGVDAENQLEIYVSRRVLQPRNQADGTRSRDKPTFPVSKALHNHKPHIQVSQSNHITIQIIHLKRVYFLTIASQYYSTALSGSPKAKIACTPLAMYGGPIRSINVSVPSPVLREVGGYHMSDLVLGGLGEVSMVCDEEVEGRGGREEDGKGYGDGVKRTSLWTSALVLCEV